MAWPRGELSRLSVGNTACNAHLRSGRIMNSFREDREPKSSTSFPIPASDLICDLSVTETIIHRTRREGGNAENKPLSNAEAWFEAAVNGIVGICEGFLVCSFLKWGSC